MAGGQQEYIWQMSGNDGPDLEWEYVPIPDTIPPPPPVKEENLPRVECILECIQYGGIKDELGALPKTRMEEPMYCARYIFLFFLFFSHKNIYIYTIYIYTTGPVSDMKGLSVARFGR